VGGAAAFAWFAEDFFAVGAVHEGFAVISSPPAHTDHGVIFFAIIEAGDTGMDADEGAALGDEFLEFGDVFFIAGGLVVLDEDDVVVIVVAFPFGPLVVIADDFLVDVGDVPCLEVFDHDVGICLPWVAIGAGDDEDLPLFGGFGVGWGGGGKGQRCSHGDSRCNVPCFHSYVPW